MVRTRKSMSSGTTMAPTNLMAASRDWRRRSANAETKSGPAGEVSGTGVTEAADGLADRRSMPSWRASVRIRYFQSD